MYKRIKGFAPTLLVATEMVGAASTFCEIIARNVQNDNFVNAGLAGLTTSRQNLEVATRRNRTNLYTDVLTEKNDTRTEALRSLRGYLDGQSGLSSKPEVKQAADCLGAIINSQGGAAVERLSYLKKTGALMNILDAFNEPEAQAAIAKAGVADLVQELSDAQAAFLSSYQSKVQTDAKTDRTLTARTECNEAAFYITKLFHYIDAQAQQNSAFGGVVSELNEAIADIMAKAHARKTRSKADPVTPAHSVIPVSPTTPKEIAAGAEVVAKAA